jgi:hypothetical protein
MILNLLEIPIQTGKIKNNKIMATKKEKLMKLKISNLNTVNKNKLIVIKVHSKILSPINSLDFKTIMILCIMGYVVVEEV